MEIESWRAFTEKFFAMNGKSSHLNLVQRAPTKTNTHNDK